MPEPANHTYLLRVWSEAEHGQSRAFRAALTDVATRETRYFTDARELAQHLRSLQGVPPDTGP